MADFNGDKWTETNACVMTAANFISVYYCFSNSINIALELTGNKEYYVISVSLALALLATYGPVYQIRSGHIRYQSVTSDEFQSTLNEPISDARVKLTNHERFILFGIGCIHMCNAIFPLLFVINNFIKDTTPKYAKITLLIGATLLGGVSSVAPIRASKKTMLNN